MKKLTKKEKHRADTLARRIALAEGRTLRVLSDGRAVSLIYLPTLAMLEDEERKAAAAGLTTERVQVSLELQARNAGFVNVLDVVDGWLAEIRKLGLKFEQGAGR